jgi:cytochrome c553
MGSQETLRCHDNGDEELSGYSRHDVPDLAALRELYHMQWLSAIPAAPRSREAHAPMKQKLR